ncbi:2,3-bisphosphoglycerate-independent phosphoglycerate mutase [Candidatus Cyanaurora vandensis]|uniref:2,3-bisphosphoglycerate-independent phosphoglycerate mutase n=1 Tax=Candidatus Cyanaurora vandensis TaxID=2714958 RepID=UPI00257FD72A|nr:2,3-bisphosphoglycerate-independent phosphoglycerate mutase [Candidatus Cyanaurora vandensis]
MSSSPVYPLVLLILDGWGHRAETDGNAIANAHTPVMDALTQVYPHTLLDTSGRAVGLPPGQMGNSEVGHLNLGAGRVVPQELVRISDAFADGSAFTNPALVACCTQVRARGGKMHLIGLCSDGGVHSHRDHLLSLCELVQQQQVRELCVHIITDGRDTSPAVADQQVAPVVQKLADLNFGQIVTVAGRYFAMDRDKRWDRTAKMYQVMTETGPGTGLDVVQTILQFREAGINDEFIPPTRLQTGAVEPGDGVIFFNFRPDRTRQLTRAFVQPNFQDFPRSFIQPLAFTTLTQYEAKLPVQVAFAPVNLDHLLGEVIAEHRLNQFRCAETEKYAHVTYFFNGGVEEPFPGEDRFMVPSPRVATYDQQPTMSAQAVTEAVLQALQRGKYSLLVVNYANPDMVGHTGNYEAARIAIETVDQCVGQVLNGTIAAGGTLMVTADHGNAELMRDEAGQPWTAHTTNAVPFVIVEGEGLKVAGRGLDLKLRSGGCLADVAPTVLEILSLPQPPEMTGVSLLAPTDYEMQPHHYQQLASR